MKQTTIKWGDILAECGNYRDGFVAIFRQYEGQPTDEKDAQGRVVKVTASSFAQHLGIDKMTFSRWVKRASGNSALPQPRSANDLGRDVTRAAKNAPDAVVTGIMNASEETQNAIIADLIERTHERMPFGGKKPKVPGEEHPVSRASEIRSICATLLATTGVLEVKLAEATIDELDEVTSSLTTVAHRTAEVLSPFVPSADTVEEWMRNEASR